MIIGQKEDAFSQINRDAARYIAGGVVSLNRKVEPGIVFAKANGSRLVDINGKSYIDYHGAFAPYLLGHNSDKVNQAVFEVIQSGASLFGAGTNLLEIELARLLCGIVPSMERIQITNTGSEATAHAIRLSRAWTRRDHIVLILGGYNGWHNEVSRQVMPAFDLIGDRVSFGEYSFCPSSAGIPESTKKMVHLINFNDLDSLDYVLAKYPVACVLLEPVLQNIGVVLPKPGYLQGVVERCEKYGSVCIFDEVKTGFRSALGGYQHIAGVKPHLSVFGKAIANGYPLGVIGGKKEIMCLFDDPDPQKRVLIAGTYNAHPVNTAAAIATLHVLMNPAVYRHIDVVCNELYRGLESIFIESGIPHVISYNASAFCVYFMPRPPADLHDILSAHHFSYDLAYRQALIEAGIYQLPIACKQGSVSYAHSLADIEITLDLTRKVIKSR